MIHGTRPLLVLMLLAGCTAGPAQERAGGGIAPRRDGTSAAATIRPVDFLARIGFLADDALRGRDTPSAGLEVAAAYIASEFRSFGLEPAGDSGSFLQRYPYTVRTLRTADATLEVAGTTGSPPLRHASDYYLSPGGPAPALGPIVFVGRAASLPQLPPGSLDGRIALADLAAADFRAVTQARTAVAAAGATGLLLALDGAVTAEEIARNAAGARGGRAMAPIPVAYLRRDRVMELATAAGAELSNLLADAATAGFRPRELTGASARIAAPVSEVTHRPPNVAGLLRGSDPVLRETYIVISAHMDHLGVGRPDASGDSIYNGADDDASGTSAVLELAEAFASLPVPPARSLIFVTVSGEEKGLLGSGYFAANLPVPAGSVIANINIDMIGRNAPDTVVAIGQEYSSLGPLVQQVRSRHPELGLVVAPDPWPEQRFFFRSDHFNFAKQEIPAIFFFTGTHEDYHRPSDEVERIDLDKITRVTRLIYHLAEELASSPEAPAWTDEDLAEVRRLTR